MLTEKEADQLWRDLWRDAIFESGCIKKVAQCKQIIKDFTEKPKREIQVGDIYLNNIGEICKVDAIEDDRVHIESATRGYYLKCGIGNPDYRHHLDISKRYKLVEIKDVD